MCLQYIGLSIYCNKVIKFAVCCQNHMHECQNHTRECGTATDQNSVQIFLVVLL
jgi:hypothetical protein